MAAVRSYVMAFNRLIERGFTHVTEEDIASEVYTAPTGRSGHHYPHGRRYTAFEFFAVAGVVCWNLYFTPTLWPDFSKEELYEIFRKFSKTNRRYGGYARPRRKYRVKI